MLINPGRYPSAIMQKCHVAVEAHGATVALTIGSGSVRFGYEVGLHLSAMLRMWAKQAKAVAGDQARKWRELGALEELKPDGQRVPLLHAGRHALALLQEHRMRVRAVGELVELVIGNVTITLCHEGALQLSGWIRTRSKEAKAAAGDRSRQWRCYGILTPLES